MLNKWCSFSNDPNTRQGWKWKKINIPKNYKRTATSWIEQRTRSRSATLKAGEKKAARRENKPTEVRCLPLVEVLFWFRSTAQVFCLLPARRSKASRTANLDRCSSRIIFLHLSSEGAEQFSTATITVGAAMLRIQFLATLFSWGRAWR